MGLKGVQIKFGVAIACFMLFIALLTMATFNTAWTQEDDARIVNVAGRQRMLSQRMSKESFEVVKGLTETSVLQATVDEFSRVLKGLADGDAELGIPPVSDKRIKSQLETIDAFWQDYRLQLAKIMEVTPKLRDALQYIKSNDVRLIDAIDRASSSAVKVNAPLKMMRPIETLNHHAHTISKDAMLVFDGTEDPATLKKGSEAIDDNLRLLKRLELEHETDLSERESLSDAIGALERSWIDFNQRVQVVVSLGDALNGSLKRIKELNGTVLLEMDKAVKMFENAGRQKVTELMQIQVFFLITGFIVGLIVLYLIKRHFVRPLLEAVDLAGMISDGILTGRVQVRSRDEVGRLGDALNLMSSNLHQLIGSVKESSRRVQQGSQAIAGQSSLVQVNTEFVDKSIKDATVAIKEMGTSMESILDRSQHLAQEIDTVSSSMEQMGGAIREQELIAEKLATAVDQSSSSIEETAVSITDVAKNASEIAKMVDSEFAKMNEFYQGLTAFTDRSDVIANAVEDIFTSMEQLDASIREVAANSGHAGKLSMETLIDARKGRETLTAAIGAMNSIRTLVENAAGQIVGLGKRVDSIGEIINVIDDIAEQTNLLALNAAIEAARAGEHGKGFAVVAEEVRKLAERAGLATKEIADLIKGVQVESGVAVEAMKRGTQEVEKGVVLAEDSGNALNTIVAGVEQTVSLVEGIAKSTQEQEAASGQVTQSMGRVSEQAEEIKQETKKLESEAGSVMEIVDAEKAATEQIAASTKEQSMGIEQIAKAINEISDVAQKVLMGSKEETAAADQIIQAVTSVTEQLDRIQVDADAHAKHVNELIALMEKLSRISHDNREKIQAGTVESDGITKQATDLAHLIEKFRLEDNTPKAIAPSQGSF